MRDRERDRDLVERLRRAATVDPVARERSWRVVEAAYADGLPVAAPRRHRLAPVLAAAVIGLALLAGATAAAAPHSAVGHFIRSVLGTAPAREPAPTLRGFPGSGRLLVQASGSTWVVSADGHRRRLGGYAGASWSPHGLFVVAWRGRDLTALEPSDGTARWAVSAPGRVSVARWAPGDGYRIAYLVGGSLRVVNGDGTGDHALAPARPGVAPAWQPHADHVLAYVDRVGRVTFVAVDRDAVLGRSTALGSPARLAWSASGRRLLVVTRGRIVALDQRGRLIASRPLRPGVVVHAIAWSPRSPVAAVSLTDPRVGGRIALLGLGHHRLTMRTLLAGPDRYGSVTWSPIGRRLLVQWPAADEWLFVDTRLEGRTHAVAGIARAFAPGAAHPPFPGTADWCCPP